MLTANIVNTITLIQKNQYNGIKQEKQRNNTEVSS